MPDLEVVVVTSSIGRFSVELNTLSLNSTIYRLDIGKTAGNIHYQTNGELLRYNFECYRFLRKLLRRESFDLCHSIMGIPAGINAWLIRRHVPYLISLQGSDVPWYSERFKTMYTVLTPIIHRLWKESSGVISNSETLRKLAWKHAPSQQIEVITNGIDRETFSPGDERDTEKKRIICVGRLIERKGIRELLEAMPSILKKIPNAHLDLVGTGDLDASLAEQIEGSGLSAHVTMHGSVDHDELPVLLRRASVFALPSHAEGMSNALLEGIACGLPVVVTDTGGTAELLDGNGLLIPIQSPPAIADALIEILADEKKREQMAEASLRVADRYSWHRMAREYFKIYRQISADESAIAGCTAFDAGYFR